ncbi:hypothetical protein BTR23_04685 [Alkalihalophilus pseudofirmus]|nr:hypothetical protein BTR23_04685 [Alkalihalophilus pseudofirmus]
MALETVWNEFLEELKNHPSVITVTKKSFANLPFLFIQSQDNLHDLEQTIKMTAMNVMKGKRLTLEMVFVRSSQDTFVYRFRFLVPNEKMFCCGNGCMDCIRYRA